MGVRALALRGAGFADDGMHAEVVNGMDVLAVRDAVTRAAELCRTGEGPVLIEASTYRYYGHSLSDPRNEYRTREEEEAWRAVDPIENLSRQLVATGVLDEAGLAALRAAASERNATGREAGRRGHRPRSCRRAQVHVRGHDQRRRSRPSSRRRGSTRRRRCPRSPRPACSSATPCGRRWSRR